MVLLPTQSVTFQQINNDGTHGQSVTALVSLTPAARDARLYAYASGFQWAIVWDITLTYADQTPIHRDDDVIWPGFRAGRAALRHVRYSYGLLPHATAYVEEIQ